MRIGFTAGLAILLVASPALALKVTNLDTVPHQVELASSGAPTVRLIQPGVTEFFSAPAHGFLSLIETPTVPEKKGKTKPKPAPEIAADGLLSGIIGASRNTGIPADADNNYTIWPGGALRIQGRIKPTQGR